jgi:putative ABC transport system substrate-binding protein
MRRRDFISLMGGATTWPLGAHAQQPAKLPTIGFLGPNTAELDSRRVGAFVQRLRELGRIEGRNIAIESCMRRPILQQCKGPRRRTGSEACYSDNL